jgi:hypothetical protein
MSAAAIGAGSCFGSGTSVMVASISSSTPGTEAPRLAALSSKPAGSESDQRSRKEAGYRGGGAHSPNRMATDVLRRFTHSILGGVTRSVHRLARPTEVFLDRLDRWPTTRFGRACSFSSSWHHSPPGTAVSN